MCRFYSLTNCMIVYKINRLFYDGGLYINKSFFTMIPGTTRATPNRMMKYILHQNFSKTFLWRNVLNSYIYRFSVVMVTALVDHSLTGAGQLGTGYHN